MEIDISRVDDVKRNPTLARLILRSYARNLCTSAQKTKMLADISVRSATAIKSSKKRSFVDPSIAVAAMGASPASLELDLRTFGFVFECMCIRDLKVYSQSSGGKVAYTREDGVKVIPLGCLKD